MRGDLSIAALKEERGGGRESASEKVVDVCVCCERGPGYYGAQGKGAAPQAGACRAHRAALPFRAAPPDARRPAHAAPAP